jgi:hypothetical protein
MNLIQYAFCERPFNPDLPLLDPANAPSLGVHLCCSHCNQPAPRCASNAEALGRALANGWQFRLKTDCVIPAGQLIHADNLLHLEDAEIFCPKCASEFQL